ncbi:MAG: VWA domain-containing protein [Planctomycetota bacterium]
MLGTNPGSVVGARSRRSWWLLALIFVVVSVGGLRLLGDRAVASEGQNDRLGVALDDEEKDHRKAESKLKKALASGNLEHIAYYLEIVGRRPTRTVLKRILAIGAEFPGEPVRTSVRRVLANADDPDAIEFLGKELVKTKRPQHAILIVEALEQIPHEATIVPLANALRKHRDKKILIEIATALRYKPSKESVDALIDFFKKVEGDQDKLWAETLISLRTLTGHDYEVYDDWANWWLPARQTWKPVDDHQAEEKAISGVYRPKRGRRLDLPEMFGQEIPSKRVAFVIDTSKSMLERDERTAEEGAGGAGKTRLERAQAELIKAIGALRKDVKFGVIAYNTHIISFDDSDLVPATRKNKTRAMEFVRGWQAEGTTNTGKAMLAALALDGVDTIILLSDGSPTDPETGKVVDVEPIIEAITEDNRFKRVTIHTLGFPGAKVSFMRALARLNHGTYANVK